MPKTIAQWEQDRRTTIDIGDPDQLLTLNETARILGISRRTLDRMLRRKPAVFRVIDVTGSQSARRIPRRDIREYIENASFYGQKNLRKMSDIPMPKSKATVPVIQIKGAPDQLLTVAQTAQLLGVSRSTVQRIIDEGQIHIMKVGKQNRISRAVVNNYIEHHALPEGALELEVEPVGLRNTPEKLAIAAKAREMAKVMTRIEKDRQAKRKRLRS